MGYGVERNFQQYFSYIVVVSFIRGENWSTCRNNWYATSHRLLSQRTLYDQAIFKGEVHLFVALANSAEYDCVVSIKSTSHWLCIHVTIQVTTFPAIFYWGVCTNPGTCACYWNQFFLFLCFSFYQILALFQYYGIFWFYILFLLSLSDSGKLGRLNGSQ